MSAPEYAARCWAEARTREEILAEIARLQDPAMDYTNDRAGSAHEDYRRMETLRVILAERNRVTEVIAWAIRMSARFGGVVQERDAFQRTYDWGQALARECYGEDWPAAVPESPTERDLLRARRWEAGDWPAWATTPRRRKQRVAKKATS